MQCPRARWLHFRSTKFAAANPKYCYEWSFVEPGRVVVLNLWHAPMREQNGIVSVNLNLRKGGEKGVRRARAEKFDFAIQEAAKNLLPIRAVINDGEMRDADDLRATASRVAARSRRSAACPSSSRRSTAASPRTT